MKKKKKKEWRGSLGKGGDEQGDVGCQTGSESGILLLNLVMRFKTLILKRASNEVPRDSYSLLPAGSSFHYFYFYPFGTRMDNFILVLSIVILISILINIVFMTKIYINIHLDMFYSIFVTLEILHSI